jgi:DNA mismatch endonuclease (patch repair protein)
VIGTPDVAFIGAKKAIFVNGCFWHGHECKVGSRQPRTNQDYWLPKIARTKERDLRNLRALIASGWSVLTIWECELKDQLAVRKKLNKFMVNLVV